MRVFLVRHGKAEPAEEWPGPDRDRPLRPRGERQARWLGERLAARPAPHRPGTIVSSPYRRAIETARILQSALGSALRVEALLEPGHAPEEPDQLLRERAESSDGVTPVALVGHNPLLESLLAHLVRGIRGDSGAMRTGELVEIEYAGPDRSRLLGRLRLDD